jgi:hypothetical protein
MLNSCTYEFYMKHIMPYLPGQTENTCIEQAIKKHEDRNRAAGNKTGKTASNAYVSTLLFVKDKYEVLLDDIISSEINSATRSTYYAYTDKYIGVAITVKFDRLNNQYICNVVSNPSGFAFGAANKQCYHYERLLFGPSQPTVATRALNRGSIKL